MIFVTGRLGNAIFRYLASVKMMLNCNQEQNLEEIEFRQIMNGILTNSSNDIKKIQTLCKIHKE